jgi:C4-type Zn-finger protein
MLNLFEVVGYTLEDGEILCPSCFAECTDKGTPFFAGDEFDTAPTCSHCLYEILAVSVTEQNNPSREGK